MLERYTRRWYQKALVDPVAKGLIKFAGFTPNRITMAAVVFGGISAVCLYFNAPFIAIIFLLLSGYSDTLDGTVARLTKTSSAQGSVLDIVADRFVEFFIVLGLYSLAPHSRATSCIFLLGAFMICITSFLVVGIFTETTGEKSFYYIPGLIERAEAFVFFILMILFPSLFNIFAILLVILVLYTAAYRVWQFYRQHDNKGDLDAKY
jgi:phosphatidylglycerophosphate synthase